MPTNILRITNERLQPAMYPLDARKSNGKYGASQAFLAGSPIGVKTSDGLLYPCKTTNAVYTLTPAAAATGGTYTITILRASDGTLQTTSALAYNASIATIQTALDTASGVANGVVASSAASASPMDNNIALTLTFSGTGYTVLQQNPPTANNNVVGANYALLTNASGVVAITVAAVQPNVVQTITPTTAAGAGHWFIGILRPTGIMGWTGPLAYNASVATIQTALDLASGAANGVVATGTDGTLSGPQVLTLTFSGTGYAGKKQPLVQVVLGGDITNTTKVLIDDTTITRDGTEVCVGFAEFPFKTDSTSNCFLTTGTAQADLVATPSATMPYFIKGYFKTADLPGWRDNMAAGLGATFLAGGTIIRM